DIAFTAERNIKRFPQPPSCIPPSSPWSLRGEGEGGRGGQETFQEFPVDEDPARSHWEARLRADTLWEVELWMSVFSDQTQTDGQSITLSLSTFQAKQSRSLLTQTELKLKTQ
ncbi:hypothetical protein KUCAC02_002273, partial [Chaenocephalus aceratus]